MAGAATAHGLGHGRGWKSSSCQSLTCCTPYLPCANLPSEAIGDQAGTARLGGEGQRKSQGSRWGPFCRDPPLRFFWRFSLRFCVELIIPLSQFSEARGIKLCFRLRSVDSQQLELNHVRIKITKRAVTMNPYANHADSDSCRAVSPRKPNLRDGVHSVGRAGGVSQAWLHWNGGADHVSPTNLTSRWTACLH